MLARLPALLAFSEFSVRQADVDDAFVRIEIDDVAVLDQTDWTADRGLRTDMADAETARCAGEAAVGDERDLAAHALPGQRRRRLQHLTHARTALRPFVANDDHVAFLVRLVLHGRERVFFAIEATRRTGELQIRHTGNFHDRAVGREITLETDNTARNRDRLVRRTNHVLVRIPFHRLEILGNCSPGDGDAIAVEIAVLQQCLHQNWNAANFEHVFGDITATRLQIGDIRCLFEDFRHIEQIEFDTAFVSDCRQMQRGIGRAAGGRDNSRRIFQRLAGNDVARADVELNQLHHLFACGHAK